MTATLTNQTTDTAATWAQLRNAVAAFRAAAHGDSNDAEIEAGQLVADLVEDLLPVFDATTSTRGPVRPDHFVLDVTAANGTPFRVIAYAPNAAGPIPAYDPTKARVEFYDRRYPHTSQGQFTGGSYFLDTLLDESRSGHGLCLAGGVDAWNIDAATMRLVEQWLTGVASAL